MKGCELCDRAARMFCESDQASLCWQCDAQVHGANFLVARHSRTLLCRRCQSPTPWKAEGPRLGSTVSFCEGCAGMSRRGLGGGSKTMEQSGAENGDATEEEDMCDDGGDRDSEGDDDDEEEEDEDEDEDEAEEEEGEDESADNQVVPWALTPPPPVASSSSSDDSSSRGSGGGPLKRMRVDADLIRPQENEATSFGSSSRHFTDRRTASGDGHPSTAGRRFPRRL